MTDSSGMDARPDWHSDEFPELRPAPPWVMEEMIAAQPALAGALLGSQVSGIADVAAAVRATGGPVGVVGCGTSEHAAMAVAALVARALGGGWPAPAGARSSLEATGEPQRGGVCVGISHDGGTRATTLALRAAREAGATTALITAAPDAEAATAADHVIVTPRHDDSWCHTLAYTSAILAGAALARELGLPGVDAGAAEALLATALERRAPVGDLTRARRVLVTGTGVDHITARELALKIAEGARLPTVAHELETALHGHLAGEDGSTGVVVVHTGDDARVTRRAGLAAAAFDALGMPVVGILSPPAAEALVPSAGEFAVTAPGGLDPALHRLLEGAIALQRLTLALVHAHDVNPDLIRRDQEPWRLAAAAAEDAGDW